ncbi:MAG: DUF2807 domain-containing protein [Bacteroidia bacterium]|nr:DUF2807 domain-containing protein [Bacteroidia bacterium]
MKKIHSLIAFTLVFVCMIQSVNAGTEASSEIRTSQPYKSIVMAGDAELILNPSDKLEISVEGTQDQIMNMHTVIKNDTLYITQINNKDKRQQRTRVVVSVDGLNTLYVKGKTDVSANGVINTDILTIRAEEGAVVNLDMRASKSKGKVQG